MMSESDWKLINSSHRRRRRSLFPDLSVASSNFDLGNILPLSPENGDEDDIEIDDYHILGVITVSDSEDKEVKTTPKVGDIGGKLEEIKTPQDANIESKLSKSKLRTEKMSSKRKLSPDLSPVHMAKNPKLDSRCRTTLFPENNNDKKILKENLINTDFSIPSERFYSPNQDIDIIEFIRNKNKKKEFPIKKEHTKRNPIKKKKKSGAKKKVTLKTVNQAVIIKNYLEDLREVTQPEGIKKLIKLPASYTTKYNNNNENDNEKQTRVKMVLNENFDVEYKTAARDNIIVSKTDSFSNDDDELPQVDVSKILSNFDGDNSKEIHLKASHSITNSENSIQLHHTPNSEILSPISQMCNSASTLVINSPKTVKNLTPQLQNLHGNKKFFPIFINPKSGIGTLEKKEENPKKKFKKLDSDQTLLDAGQKHFGFETCHQCGFVYYKGDPSDESAHTDYHDGTDIFRFMGWKRERIVGQFDNYQERIIKVISTDHNAHWKKCITLLDHLSQSMGTVDIEGCQFFLYIKHKLIIGCLVARPLTAAYKFIMPKENEQDMCTRESYPAKCGISRIWVHEKHRKTGVATSLMDCLKKNFALGMILTNRDVAFSMPTVDGRNFAAKYFGSGNFLVYD